MKPGTGTIDPINNSEAHPYTSTTYPGTYKTEPSW